MRDSHVITNFMCLGSGVARGEGRWTMPYSTGSIKASHNQFGHTSQGPTTCGNRQIPPLFTWVSVVKTPLRDSLVHWWVDLYPTNNLNNWYCIYLYMLPSNAVDKDSVPCSIRVFARWSHYQPSLAALPCGVFGTAWRVVVCLLFLSIEVKNPG